MAHFALSRCPAPLACSPRFFHSSASLPPSFFSVCRHPSFPYAIPRHVSYPPCANPNSLHEVTSPRQSVPDHLTPPVLPVRCPSVVLARFNRLLPFCCARPQLPVIKVHSPPKAVQPLLSLPHFPSDRPAPCSQNPAVSVFSAKVLTPPRSQHIPRKMTHRPPLFPVPFCSSRFSQEHASARKHNASRQRISTKKDAQGVSCTSVKPKNDHRAFAGSADFKSRVCSLAVASMSLMRFS